MENFSLEKVCVRPIRNDEKQQWARLMKQHHYLGFTRIPGRALRYVATLDGRWLALMGWGSAALKCKARDQYIGWSAKQQYQRLFLLANNVRLLMLPWIKRKNLASRILSLNVKRISDDYKEWYGHPIYLVETFVDPKVHSGICYKAANWIEVGKTQGHAKSGRKYFYHGNAKKVFLFPLHKKAYSFLSSELFPLHFQNREEEILKRLLSFPIEGLIETLKTTPDPRKRRGIRHPFHTVIGLTVCAVLCGACSYDAIADWANGLDWQTLKRFRPKRKHTPSEKTFRMVLQHIDAKQFDEKIYQWLCKNNVVSGKALAIDGKTLKGSRDGQNIAKHLLSTVIHKEGIVLSQVDVGAKTNEITRVKPLLDEIDIEGKVVTTDALLTQKNIAEYLVTEKKADYVFTVKRNQKTLLHDINDIDFKKKVLMRKVLTKNTDA